MPVRPPAFPPSLHPLSVLDGLAASAKRTPDRLAIVDDQGTLTHAELAAAVAAKAAELTTTPDRLPALHRRSPTMPADRDTLVAMLAAARIGATLDLATWRIVAPGPHGSPEDVPFAIVDDGAGRPLALSHRTVILRALNAAVMHAAFSRDTVSATPLPLTTAAGVVAAIAPLWLGGTVHFAASDRIVAHIVAGVVNQAWIAPATAAPITPDAAPPAFRVAILTARPAPEDWARWVAWLGTARVVIETHDPHLGALQRLRGPDLPAEPHIGVMLDAASGTASGLATAPPTPAWRLANMDKQT